ncbi:MAG: hypothetical protein OCC46_01530 [Pseudodesulfovibrio sp.]
MKKSMEEHKAWLEKVKPLYETYKEKIVVLISALIENEEVDYLTVTGRAKDVPSALDKIKRKQYKNPKKQLTDLCGIRIITYLESDVEKIAKLIKESFTIDKHNSLDKSETLGTDRIGYRSFHFVCSIGKDRANLPEYSGYTNFFFEVQIRTVLQHAWAELSHDRQYKFSGELPASIQRQLNLYAGMLEVADQGFVDISRKIDQHIKKTDKGIEKGKYNIEVSQYSLREYLKDKVKEHQLPITFSSSGLNQIHNEIASEIKMFGCETISDFDDLITTDLLDDYTKIMPGENDIGFVRSVLMHADILKYFSLSWNHNWTGINQSGYRFLKEKYPQHIDDIFSEHSIGVDDFDDEDY